MKSHYTLRLLPLLAAAIIALTTMVSCSSTNNNDEYFIRACEAFEQDRFDEGFAYCESLLKDTANLKVWQLCSLSLRAQQSSSRSDDYQELITALVLLRRAAEISEDSVISFIDSRLFDERADMMNLVQLLISIDDDDEDEAYDEDDDYYDIDEVVEIDDDTDY